MSNKRRTLYIVIKVEEQLQMAYMKIAELTEIISRLEKQASPEREEKIFARAFNIPPLPTKKNN